MSRAGFAMGGGTSAMNSTSVVQDTASEATKSTIDHSLYPRQPESIDLVGDLEKKWASMDQWAQSAWLRELPYIALDPRIEKNVPTSPGFSKKDLQQHIFKAMTKSAALDRIQENINSLPRPIDLDTVLLGTPQGCVYAINKDEDIHSRLRHYCKEFQARNFERLEGKQKEFARVGESFALLILPNYIHDGTHLRRARVVATRREFTVFLELDTGSIQWIESESELTHPYVDSLCELLKEPSCISRYRFHIKTGIPQLLAVAKKNEVNFLYHEHVHGGWLPMIEEMRDDGSNLFRTGPMWSPEYA
ncbi:hypothetical protein B9Z55_023019 [Caenorhabditis nigoni]|uniref:Uncharacterized protein n=2 Tax=Caenorhabditis nigoni TaxID=1611254 RepID=A0A2G5SMP1_9PELO|nr:hypothetical protein B9Z55_023019 [Caenorhabditis nigoni]